MGSGAGLRVVVTSSLGLVSNAVSLVSYAAPTVDYVVFNESNALALDCPREGLTSLSIENLKG